MTTTTLHPLTTGQPLPPRFTYPFSYEPHPLCVEAARHVQQELKRMTLSEGKMFGVLVVSQADGTQGFLAAYSGLLEGRNDWPWFVPPVYDAQLPEGHFKQTERLIAHAADHRRMSQQLQQWLFEQYQLSNARGEKRDLVSIWQDYHSAPRLRQRFPLPPGGTGDCCAPKLLQHAYLNDLRPVAMAEFWWGPSPRSEVRHHGQFYPACSGKCKPVLTWMLQGLDVDTPPVDPSAELDICIVYEDDVMAVVSKPAGLLSVPGRTESRSVATLAQQRWPEALVVHRLDQATSGLMVVGKSRDAYRQLQQQFSERRVEKRYVAMLSRQLPPGIARRGTISLPLYADPLNRPYQAVDYRLGKTAVTDYALMGRQRVLLVPHTGRTHQLRLHCAHTDGLGTPILGDELYGQRADRLYLHAQMIRLTHPVTGRRLTFRTDVPF